MTARSGIRVLAAATALALLVVACREITVPERSQKPGGPTRSLLNPAGLVVVYPDSMRGWSFYYDQTGAVCTTSPACRMVLGPGTPPLGNGSAEFEGSSAIHGKALILADFAGTRFDEITDLRYSTYRQTADTGNRLAISLEFNVDYNLSDPAKGYQGRLVFEPSAGLGGNVSQNSWQTWDARAGRWWGTKPIVTGSGASVANPCVQATPCTWAALLAAFPNIGVHSRFGAVILKAGSGWLGFRGNVDKLSIGIAGASTTFDFELFAPPSVPPLPDSVPGPPTDASLDTLPGLPLTASVDSDLVVGRALFVVFKESADRIAKQSVMDSVIHGSLLGAYRATEPEFSNYVFRVPSAGTLQQLDSIASLLRSDPRVFAAYPLGRNVSDEGSYALPRDGSGFSATLTPNLPTGTARTSGTALNLVRAPLAWGCSTGDANLAVGIYDSFFANAPHAPDLADNVAALYGPQTDIVDWHFQHGFRIASVIGARGNNLIGMSGVLWQTRMLLMDMLSDSTAADTLWTRALGNALEPVRQNNMVRLGLQTGIINFSKTPTFSRFATTTQMRVKAQWDRDLIRIALSRLRKRARYPLVVMAAGNNGIDAARAGAPAMRDTFPDQILVVGGAFDRTTRDPQSNTGTLIDLYAPAVGVGSLAPSANSTVDTLASGNSFAAPLVVGAAGLLASFDPRLQPNSSLAAVRALRTRIIDGSKRSPDRIDGKPVLDLYAVLQEAADQPGAPICGNRVWRSGDSLLVRRGGFTEPLSANLGPSTGDLKLFHRGRRIDVDYTRSLVWSDVVGWQLTTASAATTTPSGFYWSANGYDHDGSGSSWSIVSNGNTYAYWYDSNYNALQTVSMTLPVLSSTRMSDCRWQTWRNAPTKPDSAGPYPRYECLMMGSTGIANQYREGARSGGAMSPDGRYTAMPVTVVEDSYTLSDWAPCTPGTFWATTGNPTSEHPNLCRQQYVASRPLSAFLVISDSATHIARVATGLTLTERNLDWVAIAEDGREMVLQSSSCTKSAEAQFRSCSAGLIEWRSLALADGVLGNTPNFSAPLADVALPDRLRSASLRALREADTGQAADESPSARASRERHEATARLRRP